ncbi:MAG: DUF1003 domain-containing protein [Ferruginibacter sp.]
MLTKQNIITSGEEQLVKLQEIVQNAIKDEKLIVHNLVNEPKEILTKGQSISDKVATFGGSWKFIIFFSILLAVWIFYNTTLPAKDKFDPYPFILMNLVLSAIAALQAPIIMMSQNRKEERDRKRNENDYMINLKAELEVRSLHQKVDLLLEEQIKTLFESQAEQLKLLKSIEQKCSRLG